MPFISSGRFIPVVDLVSANCRRVAPPCFVKAVPFIYCRDNLVLITLVSTTVLGVRVIPSLLTLVVRLVSIRESIIVPVGSGSAFILPVVSAIFQPIKFTVFSLFQLVFSDFFVGCDGFVDFTEFFGRH